MRETCNTSGVSRRTVLLAAAGAAPLLALTGGAGAGQDRANCGPLSGHSEGRKAVRRLQLLHGPQWLQARRRRDRADWLVRSVGKEGPCLKTRLGLFGKQLAQLA